MILIVNNTALTTNKKSSFRDLFAKKLSFWEQHCTFFGLLFVEFVCEIKKNVRYFLHFFESNLIAYNIKNCKPSFTEYEFFYQNFQDRTILIVIAFQLYSLE